MSKVITAQKLTQLRFLFDKVMTPKKDTDNQDIQFQASIDKMRAEISKNQSDINLEEFDDYFKDF